MNVHVATNAAPDAETRAIEHVFQQLLDTWSRGDGAGYGALFTDNADYIGFEGRRSQGRDAIIQWHQYLFDKWLKGSRLQGEISSVRLLSPTVALIHAVGGIAFPGQAQYRTSRRSIQTLVAVKADEWRFTAFHNSRIQHQNVFQQVLFGVITRMFRR